MSKGQHAFGVWYSKLKWLKFCRHCGLIFGKSPLAQTAVKARCPGDD